MKTATFHLLTTASITACTLLFAASAQAQGRNVEIKAEKVSDNVYVLFGQGGNIGVSIGEDGVFMIDDQFAPLTPKILEAIGKLTEEPVKFLINSHWHGDHTGGNEHMSEEGAIIVAHENVRKRMSKDQFMEAFNNTVKAAPKIALPVVTFEDSITFHWNGEDIDIFHVDPAHTDGDSIIHFKNANVIHMGDVYFSGGYPFIDSGSGGTIGGVIDAVDTVLDIANKSTRIIPGHGQVTGIKELQEYRDMLGTIHSNIVALMHEGMDKEEIIDAKPTEEFDEQWGSGFMKPDQWVGIVYDGMMSNSSGAHGDGGI